jgi:hypothetical protein
MGRAHLVDNVCDAVFQHKIRLRNSRAVDIVLPFTDADGKKLATRSRETRAIREIR